MYTTWHAFHQNHKATGSPMMGGTPTPILRDHDFHQLALHNSRASSLSPCLRGTRTRPSPWYREAEVIFTCTVPPVYEVPSVRITASIPATLPILKCKPGACSRALSLISSSQKLVNDTADCHSPTKPAFHSILKQLVFIAWSNGSLCWE